MGLSIKNRNTLLVSLHQLIEESANNIVNNIFNGRIKGLITYPPNGGLTEQEEKAISQIENSDTLKSALRKILASNTGDVYFDFFNLIDGTTDPEKGDWTGVTIVDISEENDEHIEFLHDEFFATYWDWRKKRKNSNWKLDLLND
jgi:hypothetical protein